MLARKLYKVEVLNETDEAEKEINKGLVKNIWYTRTFGVKIIEELPRGLLFGENGEDICKIVDIAANFTVTEAELLSKYSLDSNRKLYSKVWKLWANLGEKNYLDRSKNWEGILAAHPKGQDLVSPISNATSLIDSLCYKRAQVLEGDQAIDIDEEGEISLKPKWSVACEHLLNAAMSYESYGFLSEDEKLQMRKPIIEVLSIA